jgi:hypothetical protein
MIIWHAYIIFTFGRFLSKLVVCHDVWDASVNIYLFHGWVNPEMGPLMQCNVGATWNDVKLLLPSVFSSKLN